MNVRKSYVMEGLDAGVDRKKQCRPSRLPVLDGAKEARLVALCCGTVPAGHGRWTLRMLADKLVELKVVESVSHETVRQALKKRIAALASDDVVHSARAQRRVCLRDGDRAERLPTPL
ncbi:MAG: helix-turn-helix domain-containing protein [Phycisphaerae bacterium]